MASPKKSRTRTRVAPNLYDVGLPSGAHVYQVRWMANGRARERNIGAVGAVSLRQAKALAAAVIADMAEQDAKAAQKTAPTFSDMCAEALADIERAKRWRNPRSAAQWRSSIERDAFPVLGRMRVDEIDRDCILRVLRPIWNTKPESARRLQQRLAAVFDWAIMKGYRETNPAQWRSNLAFSLPPISKVAERAHHDAPTLDEVRQAVAYCLAHPSPVSGCLLLTIATVCRVSEARQATAEQIAGDVWHVPGYAQKVNRGERRVPLSALAMRALAMADNAHGVLFKGLRGGMVVLDAPRLKLCKVIGRPSTVHGIRSTFRDWAAANGIDRDTAERCLSHEVGSDTERAYLRRDFLEERRAVLERWAAVMLA